MKDCAIAFTLAACSILSAGAQNGVLLEQQPYGITDDAAARQVFDQVVASEILYSSDGLKIRGFLARPKREGRYPCVIVNRGGKPNLATWTRDLAGLSLAEVASWGYVVVASQYRGAGGSEGRDEYGGKDVDDVLSLIPLLESMPQADASRIGMVGSSRGGMMTYLALSRTERIAAAVITSGMSDLFESAQARKEMGRVFSELIPDYDRRRDEVLTARSAVLWPEKLNKKTPILLFHGTADWRVSPAQVLSMSEALYRVRHPFRLVLFEGGSHGVPEYADERQRLMRDWLGKYVRDRRPWPPLEPHGN